MATKVKVKLTAKQALFVSEYLLDLNATQAAIRAGYSKKTAKEIGYENLTKLHIAAAISKKFDARVERTEVTQDAVVAELARIAFADIRDLFEWDEERVAYVPSGNLTADQAAAIAGVEAKTVRFTDKDGNQTERIELKLKTCDKIGALRELGKHLGVFVSRHEHTGPEGGPIETKHVHVYIPENGRDVVSSNGRSNGNRAPSRASRSVSSNVR